MSDSKLEHYKNRYLYYKQKCREMEKVLGRFRELVLETVPPVTSCLTASDSSTPVTPAKSEPPSDPQVSPILGGGVKRRLAFKSKEENKCYNVQNFGDEDEDMLNFEPGSNKWECQEDLLDTSDHELPDPNSTLERIKRVKNWGGLRLHTSKVSSKIRGAERRELPGQPCDQCEEYYDANGFGTEVRNKVSRHRCTHRRVPSPKGYWDLHLDDYNKDRYTQHDKSDTD